MVPRCDCGGVFKTGTMTTFQFYGLPLDEKIKHLDIGHILSVILDELHSAESKYPEWPKDKIHQAAIVNEESGELIRAALQHKYEGGYDRNIQKEAIQTAAMGIRLLKNF